MSNDCFHERTGEEVLSKSFCIPLDILKALRFSEQPLYPGY